MRRDEVLSTRWRRLQDLIAQESLAALVIAGRGIITQYGYLEYVANYCPLIRHGYAIVLPDSQPILIMPTGSDAHFAHMGSNIQDIRAAGQGDVVAENDNMPGQIASILTDMGVADGRIGLVGLKHIVPAGDFRDLQELLPQAEWSDATNAMAGVKSVKDSSELAALRETARIADDGFKAAQSVMREGVHFWEVYSTIEKAVREQGAREVLSFVETGPYFLRRPADNSVGKGDLVTVYVEITGPTGYWVEKAGLFAIGELEDEHANQAMACLEAADEAEKQLLVGNRASNVAHSIDNVALRIEAMSGIWHGHGVGLDHDLPVITSSDQTVLEPGMVVAVHPNFSNKAETVGASVADTYIIDEGGPVRLSSIPAELHRVDRET